MAVLASIAALPVPAVPTYAHGKGAKTRHILLPARAWRELRTLGAGGGGEPVQATLGHSNLATTGKYLHARPGESSGRYLPI